MHHLGYVVLHLKMVQCMYNIDRRVSFSYSTLKRNNPPRHFEKWKRSAEQLCKCSSANTAIRTIVTIARTGSTTRIGAA
eukprot:scaffold15084_cov97-Skeletonema_menzelii.AAC.1